MRAVLLVVCVTLAVAMALQQNGFASSRYEKGQKTTDDLCLHFAVKHDNDDLQALQKRFQEVLTSLAQAYIQLSGLRLQVTSPRSPSYGKHLTQEEITRLIGSPDSHVEGTPDCCAFLGSRSPHALRVPCSCQGLDQQRARAFFGRHGQPRFARTVPGPPC